MTTRSERAVVAAAGVVTVVVSSAVLTVPTSRHIAVLAALVPTAVLGVLLAVLGTIALRRRGPAADALVAAGIRLLAPAVVGLVATVGSAALRIVVAG